MSVIFKPTFEIFSVDSNGRRVLNTVALQKLRDELADQRSSFARSHALAFLANSGFADANEDLDPILSNKDELSELRYQAAIYLGRSKEDTAAKILIKNSQIDDDRVLAGVARGLGYLGDAEALESVLGIESRTEGYVKRQAAFSARLIAHRHKLDVVLPSLEPFTLLNSPGTQARAIKFTNATPDQVESCLRSVAHESYGIAYAIDHGLQLKCGEVTWMLLMNKEYVRPDAVAQLRQHRAFPAVLVRHNELSGRYGVSRLVLTAPARSAGMIDLQVYRPSGGMVFAGTAQVMDQKAHLSLRAVAHPGALSISFSGHFEGGRFSNLVASSSRSVSIKKRQPIQNR